MLVTFKELPDSARIWVYQSNRPFTEEELEKIKPELDEFVTQWTVHGADLKASYEVFYRRFIVIGIDQDVAAASGCSIDSSVRFIQHLEEEYKVDLLDKMNVTYRQGKYLAYKPLLEFKKMVKARSVSPKTVVFNNLVNTKSELKDFWEVPLSESWYKRFL